MTVEKQKWESRMKRREMVMVMWTRVRARRVRRRREEEGGEEQQQA